MDDVVTGAAANELCLNFLGVPEASYAGTPLKFRSRKVLALLIYLVVEGGWQSTDKLTALLWPESDAKRAGMSLRSTVARLRRSLRVAGDYILTEPSVVAFDDSHPFHLDLLILEAAESPEASPTVMEAAVDLARGEFLEGFSIPDAYDYEAWMLIQRAFWAECLDEVYERLIQRQLADGASAQAIGTASRWLVRSPLREAAYRHLMEAHFLAGNRSDALQVYERCVALLATELDIEPGVTTRALAKRIREADPPQPVTPESRDPTPLTELPLVGRASEHRQLVSLYREVCQKQTRVCLVVGVAGIGKTRLVRGFAAWAALATPAADVLHGRAFETGGRLPFQPLLEALRARVEQENAPEDLLADVWLSELSQLLPELRDRYPDLPPPMTGEPDFVRARIFEAVARLVQALAKRRPVVFFLDDMQWADRDTWDILHYLVHTWLGSGTRVLLILTLRQETLAATADLRERIAQLGRNTTLSELPLSPLAEKVTQQLVAVLDGGHEDETDARADEVGALGAWLHKETGGVPFFMEATLQMLMEQGLLLRQQRAGQTAFDIAKAWQQMREVKNLPLPSGMRDLIRTRLRLLSDPAKALLLAGAVIGRACTFERLCGVAGMSELEGVVAAEELLNGRLLVENTASPRPYTFAHDNIRLVVYEEAGVLRRRLYHKRALTRLEEDGAPVAELAYHASVAGSVELAFRYAVEAGDAALAAHAPAEALVHYDSARELMSHASTSGELISRLYTCRGRALELSNQYEAALANYEELARLAAERDNDTMRLAALAAQCILRATQTPLYDPSAARLLGREALTLVREQGDRALEAKVLWGLMQTEVWGAGDSKKALQYGQESAALAEALGLTEQLAFTLSTMVVVLLMDDQLVAATQANTEAQAHWQALNNSVMLADTYNVGLWLQLFQGEYDAALESGEEAARLSQAVGNLWSYAGAIHPRGLVYLQLGEFGNAIRSFETGARIAEEAGLASTTHTVAAAHLLTYLAAGHLPQARRLAAKHYAGREHLVKNYVPGILAAIAQFHLADNDLDSAERVLAEAYDTADLSSIPAFHAADVCLADARLQLVLGNVRKAWALLDDINRRLRQANVRCYLPEALWLQAKASIQLNNDGEARSLLEAAQTIAEETRNRRWLWRILWELSQLGAAGSDQEEAARLRQQAREIVSYIAKHTDSEALRASFLSLPAVCEVMG